VLYLIYGGFPENGMGSGMSIDLFIKFAKKCFSKGQGDEAPKGDFFSILNN
jgi:hypothetical protein